MQFDLRATDDGLFTRFTPLTNDGEAAWRKIHVHCPNGVVPKMHAPAVMRMLRAAGYSVTTRRPARCSAAESDALLAALGA